MGEEEKVERAQIAAGGRREKERKRIRWLAFLALFKGLALPRVSLNKLR